MTFLVLSDSHGRHDLISKACALNRSATALFFLGDGIRDLSYADTCGIPLVSVRGNCDLFSSSAMNDISTEHITRVGEYNIMLIHGHTYGVKSSLYRAAEAAALKEVDILLFGHTHTPFEMYMPEGETINDVTLKRPLRIFNPGSIGSPRNGAPSFGVITIKGKEILLSHGKI
jgi:putative phosphoesterase